MKDELRDAARNIVYYPVEKAEQLAAAIRAEIHSAVSSVDEALAILSKRIDALEAAKPQAVEKHVCLCDRGLCNVTSAKPQAVEPRRNPYEDWRKYNNDRVIYSEQDLRHAQFMAWDRCAQTAERDA